MRDYGRVHGTFWSSPTTANMTDKGKLLALYLMSCTHGTIAGVFRLPDGYIAEDLQWDTADVRQAFVELLEKGFANRCETTKWVWLVKHLEWNPPENPNQRKAAVKVVSGVPSNCFWRPAFMRACGKSLGLDVGSVAAPMSAPENPSATVPETVVQPVTVAVTAAEAAAVAETEAGSSAEAASSTGKPAKSANNSSYSPEFEQVWKDYPMRPGHSKAEAYKCWNARIAGGENVQTMANGVRRYADYCQAERTEARFVKHAATFFGPDRHYLNDWTPTARLEPSTPCGKPGTMTDEQRAAAGAASTAEAAKLLGFTAGNEGEVIDATE